MSRDFLRTPYVRKAIDSRRESPRAENRQKSATKDVTDYWYGTVRHRTSLNINNHTRRTSGSGGTRTELYCPAKSQQTAGRPLHILQGEPRHESRPARCSSVSYGRYNTDITLFPGPYHSNITHYILLNSKINHLYAWNNINSKSINDMLRVTVP